MNARRAVKVTGYGIGLIVLLALLAPATTHASGAKHSSDARRASDPEARDAGEFHGSWKLAAGQTIEIKGVNGSIEASIATGDKVEVSAVKRARRSDPDEVTIETLEHEGGITLCVHYPAPPGKTNECAPGRGGQMNTRNNDVQVRFTVRVPAGVRFAARTVNGDVDARGLKSPVDAETVNGSIRVSTSSYAEAVTVNGSIDATMGARRWPESLTFNTVNGGITLELPEGTGADLKARTVNGEIESDFPVTVIGKFGRRHLEGRLGEGGGALEMETVNGSIRLRTGS